jgi:hypothetical protein
LVDQVKQIRVLTQATDAKSKTGVRHLMLRIRAVFTHGPKGPGPRAANFQGRRMKKIAIEVWYAEKKAVDEREI